MNAPLLQVCGLSTGFVTPSGIVRAVESVSLHLDAGEALGIVGESGSGKSVLARSIMGLLPRPPYTVSSGEVILSGVQLRQLSERELTRVRGRKIAMIFQDPLTSLNPVLTVGRQIEQVLRQHTGLTSRAAAERAVELLAQVNIPGPRQRARDYPHQLSGGMRQRAVIAIALACGPSLLIADEPTTALDVTIQAQILDLLRDLQQQHSMALILISHNMGVVAGMCDRVAVMYAGRVVEEAPADRLFASPRMRYTAALLKAMPRLETPSHTPLHVIAGQPPRLIDATPGCSFAARCEYALANCDDQPDYTHSARAHRYACWNPAAGDNNGR